MSEFSINSEEIHVIYEENKAYQARAFKYWIDENGCHNVLSHSTSEQGYIRCMRNGKNFWAHRYIWELVNERKIPEGMVVRHTCDNPRCINLAHLKLGTQADNMRDMVNKGRQACGSMCSQAKLNESDVFYIRFFGEESVSELAESYDVSTSTIRAIKANKTWKHVTMDKLHYYLRVAG